MLLKNKKSSVILLPIIAGSLFLNPLSEEKPMPQMVQKPLLIIKSMDSKGEVENEIIAKEFSIRSGDILILPGFGHVSVTLSKKGAIFKISSSKEKLFLLHELFGLNQKILLPNDSRIFFPISIDSQKFISIELKTTSEKTLLIVNYPKSLFLEKAPNSNPNLDFESKFDNYTEI